MGKKITTEDFIEKAIEIHGNKYDYSLVEYKGSRTKVKIICKEHGIFEQEPLVHNIMKCGCSKCGNSKKMTTEEFILKSKKTHKDKYNYSLTNYINKKTKVQIICQKHGIFEQTPNNHYHHGCFKCDGNYTKNKIDFIKKANIIHNYKYDYSLVNYINARNKVKIICPTHGIFNQVARNHYKNGCSKCRESNGEKQIRYYLKNNNINYIQEKIFNDMKKGKSYPRFDFYLPEKNICIEYDGVQHFKIVKHFGGRSGFMKRKHKDKQKDEYCKNNNIHLLRIAYTQYNNIGKILKNLLT